VSDEPSAAVPFARHPARRGAWWLAQAFAMFNAHRVGWLLLLLAYYAITLVVQLVPLAGPIAWILLKPVFSVGFLAAAWTQERGGTPRLSHLFTGFRSNLWALMPLGIVFVLGISLAIYASTLVDGGRLVGLATGSEKFSEELLEDGRLQVAMLFAAACSIPVVLALWFAPALVVFNDAGTWAALGTSLRAALANWRAVATYGILVFFCTVIVPSLLGVVVRLLPDAVASVAVAVLVIPYVLAFMATLHASDYVSYRDIFHAGEAADQDPLTPA
jgi:hypothetical protein